MTESGSTSSKSQSASGQEFPFSNAPPMRRSEETVLNPEGRSNPASTGELPKPDPASEVHGLLFPDLSQISAGELPPSPSGVKLAHFEIVDRIGMGGMGSVFLALDSHLQRYVALKILAPSQAREASAIQRFINEARAAARLDYDGIARVHFYGEDRGYHFIAFEYVTGTNIRELIQHQGPLDPSDAINFTLQVAHALKHTSAAGVVHRDIKPSNIIVNPAGRAKLVDLGLARKESSESMDDLTVAGTTLGTFDYISPEQAQDPRNVDVRSDIYSLGCTLFHMLTGEPPYPEGTLAQKLLEHQQSYVPNPSDTNRKVPAQLAAVTQKMMASDPKKRYQSPESLIRDLLMVASDQGLKGVTPEGLVWTENVRSQQESFLSKHIGWLAAIAVLVLIIFAIERLDQEPASSRSTGNPGQVVQSDGSSGTDFEVSSPKEDEAELPTGPEPLTSETSQNIGGSLSPETNGPPNIESASNLLELIQPDGIFNRPPSESAEIGLEPLIAKTTSPDLKTPENGELKIPLAPPELREENSDASEGATIRPAPPLPEESNQPSSPLTVENNSPVVLWAMGASEPQEYKTLEAACANARSGSIIELRYNGFLENGDEKPITINKHLTIRAAKDYRPVISFSSRPNPDESDTNMLTVREGNLNLVDVGLHFKIQHGLTYPARDRWTLISVQGTEKISLKNVTATIENLDREPASMFEFVRGLVTKMSEMDQLKSNGGNVDLNPYLTTFNESVFRGECDAIVIKSSQPGRFKIDNSLLAVEGSLIVNQGSTDMPNEQNELEINVNHSTLLSGMTAFQFDSGEVQRFLLPVSVSTENSIFAVVPEFVAPFVAMKGSTNPSDLRATLSWYGRRNFYHGFQVFWTISDNFGSSEFADMDFTDWEIYWNASEKTIEDAAISGEVEWSDNWRANGTAFSQLNPGQLQIETDSENQQDFLASDGSILGAPVESLPTPSNTPLTSDE